MKIRLNYKTKSLIFLVIFILGDVFVLTFIIHKTVKEIARLNSAIERERARIESSYQRRKSARLIVENANRLQKELPALEAAILHSGEELNLVTTLEEAALHHDILQKINISPREGKKEFGDKINITLTVNGAFPNLLKYLDDLERSKILIIFDNIAMSKSAREEERAAGRINGLLQGHFYFTK